MTNKALLWGKKCITLLVLVTLVSVTMGCDSMPLLDSLFWKDDVVVADYVEPEPEKVEEPEPTLKPGETPYVDAIEHDEDKTEEDAWNYTFDDKHFQATAANADEVSLIFAGDLLLAEGNTVYNAVHRDENGLKGRFDETTLANMRDADIFMVNNEFPYTDRGTPTPGKAFTFRGDPADAAMLHDIGVDIVSLANNHAYDYGRDSIVDTLATLKKENIPYAGAGMNFAEASMPVYFHINDKIIAFVSATRVEGNANPETKGATETEPGVLRTYDPEVFLPVIEEADKNSDFVVVYVHWGQESTDLVRPLERDLSERYAQAGADLIMGDHSHCLQGIDYVGDVPVFYSLGNYLFNSRTLDTCLVRVVLDTTGEKVTIKKSRFIPCIQTNMSVRVANNNEWDRIIRYEQGISNYAEIDEEGFVTKSDVNHNIQNGMNTSPARKIEEPTPVPEEGEEIINQ